MGSANGYFFPYLAPLDDDPKPIYRLHTRIDPFYEPLPSPSNDQQVTDIDHYGPHTTEPTPQVDAYPLWTKETKPISKEQLLGNYTAAQQNIDSIITNALSPTSDGQVYGSR